MNPLLIVAIAVSLSLVIAALALYRFSGAPEKISNLIMDRLPGAAKSLLGPSIKITVLHDCLGIEPVAELALAQVRIRSIAKYQNTSWINSEKIIIATQVFDVKLGWNLKDDVRIEVMPGKKTVRVLASKPKILTIAPAGGRYAPETLYSADGFFNKLTPVDQNALTDLLYSEVRGNPSIEGGLAAAQKHFEDYFWGFFAAQGFVCSFDYKQLEG